MIETNQVLGKPVYITGENHPFRLSRAQICRVNKQYVGFSIEKAYGIKLKSRMVYIPPANKKWRKNHETKNRSRERKSRIYKEL